MAKKKTIIIPQPAWVIYICSRVKENAHITQARQHTNPLWSFDKYISVKELC